MPEMLPDDPFQYTAFLKSLTGVAPSEAPHYLALMALPCLAPACFSAEQYKLAGRGLLFQRNLPFP